MTDDLHPEGDALPANAPGAARPIVPDEPGSLPSPAEPDPAPERDEAPTIDDPRDRGGTGAPVGANNIVEGRVDGVMTPPDGTHGEGGGG